MSPTILVDGVRRPTTNSSGRLIAETEGKIRSFWRWFGGSKVIDVRGRPIEVFHGTARSFTRFRLHSGNELRGVFFSSDPEDAREWGSLKGGTPRIVAAYLRILRPADGGSLIFGEPPERATRRLRRLGLDGYADDRGGATEYVVFSPAQIRTTGNRGAVDIPALIVDDLERSNPTAYHGSQATFTAFTSVGIGKNHGMGYGWGAYLTSDPQTAQAYAGKGGAVYVVRIPRGPWMPWVGHDTSRAVRAAAKRALAPLRHVMSGGLPLGEEFYQRHSKQGFTHINGCFYNEIATLLGDNVGDATSHLLRQCGIVGVTYAQRAVRLKDGTMTPEGATNYCIFDPKDLQIVGKQ